MKIQKTVLLYAIKRSPLSSCREVREESAQCVIALRETVDVTMPVRVLCHPRDPEPAKELVMLNTTDVSGHVRLGCADNVGARDAHRS